MVRVWPVEASAIEGLRPRLCDILIDAVAHGAGIGFLDPLAAAEADAYWRRVENAIAGKRRILLVAAFVDSLVDAGVVGTVQLDINTMPNQPHRATVNKLIVHTTARHRGVGVALMTAVERVALDNGRWLLTLDTATDEAARLYVRLGWQVAGVIPKYALNPDGTLTSTTFYWKELAR